jgi:response regulator RpfG family c-di-GMP phosphodiesterase
MERLGATDTEIIMAGFDGVLHDVGKVDVSIRDMIRAPRALFPWEKLTIARRHTALGASLISALNVEREDEALPREASVAAFFHHHPPEQLAGLYPVGVRIVQIADQFDAMQDSGRPYLTEGVFTADEAAAEIRNDLEAADVYDALASTALDSLLERYGD